MAFQSTYSHIDSMVNKEIGRKPTFGRRDWLYSSLYSSFKSLHNTETTPHQGHDWGAVFGFGFSPDGKILTAACEHRCMMLYDPLNAKLITRRFNTHDDCVNCVKFLDNRVFATCSDDNTVRLWDSRYLTNELRILKGHSSWVKNIEYASTSGKLVTSGFDGNIFAWDINNFSSSDTADPIFYINGALRTKMTMDESKLIVSTLGGYFLIIHNLDLEHLKDDLSGFKPHLYRLMQLMNTPLHHALQYNYMFTRHRNRVEFMCDFPDSDNAESIATMQIHPHDWCVVSRNTTLDEETEWTCVHDIQSNEPIHKIDPELQISKCSSKDRRRRCSDSSGDREKKKKRSSNSFPGQNRQERLDFFSPMWAFMESNCPYSELHSVNTDNTEENSEYSTSSSSSDDEEEGTDEEADTAVMMSLNATRQEHHSSSLSSHSPEDRPSSSSQSESSDSSISVMLSSKAGAVTVNSQRIISPPAPSVCSRWQRRRMAIVHNSAPNQQQENNSNRAVHTEHLRIRNVKPRLLSYIEEPNVGRGFIKEQSFSSDGRVIASPYGYHVRLLSFDKQCHELCDVVPTSPTPLVEISNCALMKSNILTSTFSPVQCLLAAGAVDGSISFCHPVL